MTYSVKINGLAANIINKKCVVKKFSSCSNKIDLQTLLSAYLEQAEFCIEAYRYMIGSYSHSYYDSAQLLNQAAYAVRQAGAVRASYWQSKELNN